MQHGATTTTTQLDSLRIHYSPHKYQEEAITLMLRQACLGLLLHPGLGKTSITLAASYVLLKKKLIKGVLVIAPLRPATLTWPDEVSKWEQFANLDLVVLHGKNKDKLLAEKHDIYVINPEGLDWLFQPKHIKKTTTIRASRMSMLMSKFDMLVIDESTKFKAYSSLRFRILRATLNFWRRRYILTGTPAPNGLKDLWAQIYILDQGVALEPYITHFRNKYFYTNPWNKFELIPYAWSAEEIALRIANLTLRMKAEDYLTLPEMTYDRIDIVLPPDARRQYDDMEEEFLLRVEAGTIVAANAAVASGKMRQIANGAAYLPGDEHAYTKIHLEKAQALADLVEELQGEAVLVAVEFRFEVELIREVMGAVPMLGEGSKEKDAELMRMFNLGMIPCLLGNPASVGHGLNLQKACAHVAFYSLTWNLEYFDQFIKRVLRQGNESLRVIVHILMVKDSIDEAVWDTLMKKELVQENILTRLKQLHIIRNTCNMVSGGGGAANT